MTYKIHTLKISVLKTVTKYCKIRLGSNGGLLLVNKQAKTPHHSRNINFSYDERGVLQNGISHCRHTAVHHYGVCHTAKTSQLERVVEVIYHPQT